MMKQYQLEEWQQMASRARANLDSACPLLEDEVTVAVADRLDKLEALIGSTEHQLKMIKLAELMEDLDINRFEYITEDGREVVSYAKHTFQLQDDLRTLKVFREKK
jgi:sulfur carrier protein ThiS